LDFIYIFSVKAGSSSSSITRSRSRNSNTYCNNSNISIVIIVTVRPIMILWLKQLPNSMASTCMGLQMNANGIVLREYVAHPRSARSK